MSDIRQYILDAVEAIPGLYTTQYRDIVGKQVKVNGSQFSAAMWSLRDDGYLCAIPVPGRNGWHWFLDSAV